MKIDPTVSVLASVRTRAADTRTAGDSPASTGKPAASTGGGKPSPASSPRPPASPAATVSTSSSVPASVPADERALYLQLLRQTGGNQALALAALHRIDQVNQAAHQQ